MVLEEILGMTFIFGFVQPDIPDAEQKYSYALPNAIDKRYKQVYKSGYYIFPVPVSCLVAGCRF
jgi:hypothetical protein